MNLDILYQDEHIVIANKIPGIAMSHDNPQLSMIDLLSIQLGLKMFLTHRIDQVVSGVCLFAKNAHAAESINALFRKNLISKKYLAIVPGGTAIESQDIRANIFHDKKRHKAYINPKKGKPSQLRYRRIATSDNYDLLEVDISTGRFHQIRCLLAHKGIPIKGDVKYGARRSNKDRSIDLHAFHLAFVHPYLQEFVSFSAPLRSETLWQYFASKI